MIAQTLAASAALYHITYMFQVQGTAFYLLAFAA